MKYLSKLVPFLGGAAMLAAGCGNANTGNDAYSYGQADAVAGDAKALQIFAGNTSTDLLIGYYSSCRGHVDGSGNSANVPFEIGFGVANPDAKVVAKDASCSLTATGVKIKDPVTGTLNTYMFHDPSQADTDAAAREIVLRDGYRADDAVLLRDASKRPAGLLNIKGAGMAFTGVSFSITAITGSSATTLAAAVAASKLVGYSTLAAAQSETWAVPNWTLTTTDTRYVIDIDGTISEAGGTFRLARGASDPSGGEAIWGVPTTFLQTLHADGAHAMGAEVDTAMWADLSDTHRFDILFRKYSALTAGGSNQTLSLGSGVARSFNADLLYPVGTQINSANANNRKNVIVIERADTVSGVRSYQGILVNINVPAGSGL